MRKKTALRTPQQRETSLRKPGGLIVRGKNAQDSATAKSTLTNRSHRTRIRQNSLNRFGNHISLPKRPVSCSFNEIGWSA